MLRTLIIALGLWLLGAIYGVWYSGNNAGMDISLQGGKCVTGITVDTITINLPFGHDIRFPYGAIFKIGG